MIDLYTIKTRYSSRREIYKRLPLVVFLLFFPALFLAVFPGKIALSSLLCMGIISLIVFRNLFGFNYSDFHGRIVFYLLLFYNFVTFLRGLFTVDCYSTFVSIVSGDIFVSFIFPFFLFLADFDLLKRVWKSLILIGLPCCAILFFFPAHEDTLSFGHDIAFVNIFVLCLPFLFDKKYYIYFLFCLIFAIFYDLDRRSITINCFVVIVIIIMRKIIVNLQWRRLIYLLTVVIPFGLLILGLNGTFNVFKYVESFSVNIDINENRKYNVDSRTSIYTDVFGELTRQNKEMIGLGLRGKTKTSLADHPDEKNWFLYRNGRTHTESGMLNFFQYGGIMGYLVYSFFVLSCAYYALFRSKNDFIKILGYYVCFKYIYSFIEEPLSPAPVTFYAFILYGMCLNKKLGALTNREMTLYLNSIFKRHKLLTFD